MGQVSSPDDQARFRAEMKRSGAIRNGMVAAALDQAARSVEDAVTAWLRRPRPSKEAARGPVAQQDRAAVS